VVVLATESAELELDLVEFPAHGRDLLAHPVALRVAGGRSLAEPLVVVEDTGNDASEEIRLSSIPRSTCRRVPIVPVPVMFILRLPPRVSGARAAGLGDSRVHRRRRPGRGCLVPRRRSDSIRRFRWSAKRRRDHLGNNGPAETETS